MLAQIKILTALELKNLFGLNTLRHTKDKAKKRNAALLSVAWVMLIAMVVFYVRESGEPFLRITVYSGSSREIRAVQGNQFLLSRQPETLYAAELLEGNENWEHSVTADQVREAFNLIVSDWTTGNN